MSEQKSFKAQDSFHLQGKGQVYMVFSEESDPTPTTGETVIINDKSVKIKSVDRRCSCICGKCGPKNSLYIVQEPEIV